MSESFEATTRNGLYNGDSDMISRTGTSALTIRISDTIATTVSSFKTWLSDKYSAGHPVEVWYVLANETTEQTTFPTVTPTQGANTLSVSTTLAPSKTRLTATSGVWPKNPIEPEEFGERTRNLFNINATPTKYRQSTIVTVDGQKLTITGEWYIYYEIDVVPNTNYYVKWAIDYAEIEGRGSIAILTASGQTTIHQQSTSPYSFNSGENQRIRLYIYAASSESATVTLSNIMLNAGSQALPYEPYGKYKIPITNSGQTYNIFLNEPLRKIGTYADKVRSDGVVERKVRKLVIYGTENWSNNSNNACCVLYITDVGLFTQFNPLITCTHMKTAPTQGDLYNRYVDYGITFGGASADRICIRNKDCEAVTAFKQWLSDEYSAGHPVEVWYVLNTPTTESITAPEIATTQGTNTLTVDTTLIPSSTEITLHAKPIRFGFKIDKTNDNSDTAVAYTHDAVTMTPAAMNFTTGEFNYGSWENVWFVKDTYPVALNLDGTIAYRLDPDDYTKKMDGTPSDIFYELLTAAPSDWSTQWKQYYTKSGDEYVLNSQDSAPTFATDTYYKLTYNSSFTGNFMMAFPKVWFYRHEDSQYNYIEISNQKLSDDWKCYAHINASGQEVDFIYLPLFKGVIVDSKLRSVPGVIPQGGTTATAEVNAATACGSRWQIWDHSSVELINDLLILMSKSINSQGKFGKGRESGYDSSDTVTYGKLQTGTLVKGGKFKGFSSSYKEVKVFGMEGFWANRWDRLQGMLLVNNVWKIKMTPPYNFTGTDFVTLSNASVPTGNGYLSKVQTSEYGSIPASIDGGSSAKYFKDYFYKTATDTRVAIRGGSCNSGAYCGFRCVSVGYAASISYWGIGASPVYK